MAKRKSNSLGKMQVKIINKKAYGAEPIVTGPINKIDLINCMNWYSGMLNLADSKEFLVDYYSGNPKFQAKLKSINNTYDVKSYGWIARMISNGTIIDDETVSRMDAAVKDFVNKSVLEKEEIKSNKVVVNIQDKIKERSYDIIGEIEYMIDNGQHADVYEYLKTNNVPAMYGTKIVDYYTPIHDEIKLAISGKNVQLKEAYSNYKAKDMKSLDSMYKSIIDQVNKFSDNTKREKVRKPRKKKSIPATKKISGLQYLKEFNELKIVSVDPASIIGAKEVWLFNTTNSTLTKLVASGASLFDVKGTSILNVDLDNSISKRVGRKSQEVVDTVLKGGKVKLRKVFDMVTAKATKPTNRTNAATVILKVVK